MAKRTAEQPHNLGVDMLTVAGGVVLAAIAGGITYSTFVVPHNLPLPNAVSGERRGLRGKAGEVSYYVAGQGQALLLVHSINAAASAYEVRPLFEHYRSSRRVYAPDLPGFGFSERSDRGYTPRLYTDAVIDMAETIVAENGGEPIDAIAISLGCEFLARAASERPDLFRSLALVSPTAFRKGDRFYGEPGSLRGNPALARVFGFPLWGQALFDALNSRASERYFYERTFGSKHVDEGLLEYAYLTAHQPGGPYAPFTFISGALFSADIDLVYDRLELPIWLSHGVRGDFQDYTGVTKVINRPNWQVYEFDSGALTHFDLPNEFIAAYDHFLAQHTATPVLKDVPFERVAA